MKERLDHFNVKSKMVKGVVGMGRGAASIININLNFLLLHLYLNYLQTNYHVVETELSPFRIVLLFQSLS